MSTFFVRHRVADYDAWRVVYDGAGEMQRAAGVTEASVYRDADDPHEVLVVHRFGSREQAEAFMGDSDAKAAMAAAGVDLDSIRVEVYEDAT